MDGSEGPDYDHFKLLLGKIRKSMDLAFNSLDQGLNECPPSDVRLAVEATRVSTTTREHIMRHLGSLTASDVPALKKGFAKLDEDIRALLLQLDKPMKMMPAERAVRIRQGWDTCREVLKAVNGSRDGAAKPEETPVMQGASEKSNGD